MPYKIQGFIAGLVSNDLSDVMFIAERTGFYNESVAGMICLYIMGSEKSNCDYRISYQPKTNKVLYETDFATLPARKAGRWFLFLAIFPIFEL